MNTIYLFCVGGSGLRILRSFIMLLSAGYKIPGYRIKPVIVDPHLSSKDLNITSDLLSKYRNIQEGGTYPDGCFFCTPVDFDDRLLNLLSLSEVTRDKSFGDFIGYSKMGEEEQGIIDVLYSSNNISKKMNVGFKGNPNVGCVVFQDFVKGSDWINQNLGSLKPEDKIILVGSLFGGTGASGLPSIARDIHSKTGDSSKLALIALTPYFQLDSPSSNNPDNDIDSNTFDMKSFAALNFYKKNCDYVDTFYILGDNTVGEKYNYDEENQGNKAHFIELVAATAIKDFAENSPDSKSKWKMFYSDLDSHMTFRQCKDSLKEEIKCLAKFYILGKFLFFMKDRKEARHYLMTSVCRRIKNDQTEASKLVNLEHLIYDPEEVGKDSFIQWIAEMRDNQRSFDVVNTEDIIFRKEKDSCYQFVPSTECRIYNGAESLNDLNMSVFFLNISKAYRTGLKTRSTMTTSDFIRICYDGISKLIN